SRRPDVLRGKRRPAEGAVAGERIPRAVRGLLGAGAAAGAARRRKPRLLRRSASRPGMSGPRPLPVSELRTHVGQEVGVSEWLAVTQDMIDRFADTTGDWQWIHVDRARAAAESRANTTIAHG